MNMTRYLWGVQNIRYLGNIDRQLLSRLGVRESIRTYLLIFLWFHRHLFKVFLRPHTWIYHVYHPYRLQIRLSPLVHSLLFGVTQSHWEFYSCVLDRAFSLIRTQPVKRKIVDHIREIFVQFEIVCGRYGVP